MLLRLALRRSAFEKLEFVKLLSPILAELKSMPCRLHPGQVIGKPNGWAMGASGVNPNTIGLVK